MPLSNTPMSYPPLHVFIFASENYHSLLPYCAKSVTEFLDHEILTKNIVSNKKISLEGWQCILDHDFWHKIDTTGAYRNIYQISHVRQQIFKMSLDTYVQGMVLIIDAEVLFLRKTMFSTLCGKHKLYATPIAPTEPHYAFTERLCKIGPQTDLGFITDVMMCSTDTLVEIKTEIEKIHGVPWIHACQMLIDQNTNTLDNSYAFSEFELIANFLLRYHGDDIDIQPHQHYVIKMMDRQNLDFEELIKMLSSQYPQDYISVNPGHASYDNNNDMAWLTFYYSIKDPSWPDCWNASDFGNLPLHIQQECITTFKYKLPD